MIWPIMQWCSASLKLGVASHTNLCRKLAGVGEEHYVDSTSPDWGPHFHALLCNLSKFNEVCTIVISFLVLFNTNQIILTISWAS